MQRVIPDRIRLLPEQLANQIAAGEVVERPASVVKELVENSLDAGATRIDIDVEDGGRRAIHVQDNGCGIHVEDLPLAVTRHATSKLRSFDDLVAIASLGFRGEALPSIASVSRFQLSSRYRDSDSAYRIAVDASGRSSAVKPDPQPSGTRISVEELFINTPARRRFLRSAKTEFVHIHDVVMRAALSRFDVAFTLTHNARQVLRLPVANDPSAQRRRLSTFFGQAVIEQARPVNLERDGTRVHGWVLPASCHRAQADRQFVFVNGRMLRDRMLLHAIRQAYGDALPPGRSAMFAIYIELDPARVDVNVHPTKHEVRFREMRNMHDLLYSAVQQALQQQELPIQNDAYVAGATDAFAGRVREASAATTYPASHKVSYLQQGLPRTKQVVHVQANLPGQFALVKEDDQTWLYDMGLVAKQVFSLRVENMSQASPRPLLIPCRLQLAEEQAQWFATQQQILASGGIVASLSGQGEVVCQALSPWYSGVDVEQLLKGVLETRVTGAQDLLSLAARSLGKSPALQTMQTLLDELLPDLHAQCRRAISDVQLRQFFQELAE